MSQRPKFVPFNGNRDLRQHHQQQPNHPCIIIQYHMQILDVFPTSSSLTTYVLFMFYQHAHHPHPSCLLLASILYSLLPHDVTNQQAAVAAGAQQVSQPIKPNSKHTEQSTNW